MSMYCMACATGHHCVPAPDNGTHVRLGTCAICQAATEVYPITAFLNNTHRLAPAELAAKLERSRTFQQNNPYLPT